MVKAIDLKVITTGKQLVNPEQFKEKCKRWQEAILSNLRVHNSLVQSSDLLSNDVIYYLNTPMIIAFLSFTSSIIIFFILYLILLLQLSLDSIDHQLKQRIKPSKHYQFSISNELSSFQDLISQCKTVLGNYLLHPLDRISCVSVEFYVTENQMGVFRPSAESYILEPALSACKQLDTW